MAESQAVSAKPEVNFMSLVKFDQTKKDVFDLAQKSKDLKINGLDDKEGYKAVHEAQMKLREVRVKGEKDRLNFSRMLIDTGKQLKSYHDEIFSPIIEEEERLKSMKDEIEAEKQKIKDEEARKERERIQERVSRLMKSGATYNPMSPPNNTEYRYGDLIIDMVMISTMAESVFESFIENVVATKKIDDDRIAEEEKAKIAAQKELDDQRIAQEEKQKELDEKEEKIRIAQKAIDDAKAEELKQKEINAGIEKAKADMKIRLKKEEAERVEREAKAKLVEEERAAKNKKYITWLKKYDLTPDMVRLGREESDYWVEIHGDEYLLFKKVDEIIIK